MLPAFTSPLLASTRSAGWRRSPPGRPDRFSLGSRRNPLLALVQIAIGLLLLYAVVRLAIRLTGRLIGRSRGLDPTQQLLSQKLAAIVIIVIAFFVGIDLAGIDLTALAVFSGALGLAVGFGLQKTVGNLFAGIILLMDRSIKPGDVISVGESLGSAGESFGSVNKIGVRASRSSPAQQEVDPNDAYYPRGQLVPRPRTRIHPDHRRL